MRSASVDLPWSMCAMMQKLRSRSGAVDPGAGDESERGTSSMVPWRGGALGSRTVTGIVSGLRDRLARRWRQPGEVPAPAKPGRARVYGGPVRFAYAPEHDGHPDPGEVVWTWVPFEEDATRGKDRPVVVLGWAGATGDSRWRSHRASRTWMTRDG